MEHIRNKILMTLANTALSRIPIAIESGSRAWGFFSRDSDYDCRLAIPPGFPLAGSLVQAVRAARYGKD